MKRPEFLVLIAVWEFITAFGTFIGLCIIATFILPGAASGVSGPALAGVLFGYGVAVMVLMMFIALAIAGGIGLIKGKEWGRVLSIVHGALGLFFFPVGTAIGVLLLLYLTRPDIRESFLSSGN